MSSFHGWLLVIVGLILSGRAGIDAGQPNVPASLPKQPKNLDLAPSPELPGINHGAHCTADFLPGGKSLISFPCYGTKEIRIWDLKTETLARVLPLTDMQFEPFILSPDGRWVVCRDLRERELTILSVSTGKRSVGIKFTAQLYTFTPDSKTLIALTNEGVIHKANVTTGGKESEFKLARVKGPYDFFRLVDFPFSADGTIVASKLHGYSEPLRLWSTETGELLQSLQANTTYPDLAFSRDGKRIATTGSDQQQIDLWDVKTGERIRTIKEPAGGNANWITMFSFSPDGKTLVATGGKLADLQPFRLYDIATGKQIASPKSLDSGWLTSAVFSGDSKKLAGVQRSGAIRIWDLLAPQQK